ncbi:hypothetical protein SCLCIDRAFT_1217825 [Scleroderma citrinum Foug A]|uniref:Hydrophobin n=1 Tax=Scleroderma citrinum Foug A TaxID=1036808 RepID=A0A0C3DST4_9AGAM|nr:hypothetical protein SCLCIDRAFT_1217825 [Scleroderma citrinum Foug A]
MPLWMMLLSLAVLAASSPAPAPEPAPAPIDPSLAAVIASNLNLACTNGCSGSSNAQQLDTNGATVGSAVSPLHLFGTVAIVGGVLAAL